MRRLTRVRELGQSPLARTIFSLYVVQGLNYILPLTVLPFLLRVLGPRHYGAVAFAQSLMTYAVITTDFGFNLSATRAISLARGEPEEVSRIFWTVLFAKMLLLVAVLIVIAVGVFASPTLRTHAGVIMVCSIAVVGSVFLPQWYFQGLEKMQIMAAMQAVSRICVLPLIFVLVRSPKSDLFAATLLSTPSLIGSIFCLLYIRLGSPLIFYRPSAGEILSVLKNSWHLFLSNVATTAYVAGNGFILGFVAGDSAVASYTLANKAALAAFYLLVPISQAVFPRASVVFQRSIDDGREFVRKLSLPFIGCGLVVSLVLEVFASPIVRILGGVQYEKSVDVLRVMAALPVVLSLALLLAQIVMINLEMSRALSRIYVVMALLSLIVLPVLGKNFGALGGAISLGHPWA